MKYYEVNNYGFAASSAAVAVRYYLKWYQREHPKACGEKLKAGMHIYIRQMKKGDWEQKFGVEGK
jgi:hypothetical protein